MADNSYPLSHDNCTMVTAFIRVLATARPCCVSNPLQTKIEISIIKKAVAKFYSQVKFSMNT